MEDAQLVVDHLQEALRRDKSARGGIVVDEDHTLELLHFQTGHMRKLFKSFPEILLIDGTYNVNGQGMPLYCLMVEDGYGRTFGSGNSCLSIFHSVKSLSITITRTDDQLELSSLKDCMIFCK